MSRSITTQEISKHKTAEDLWLVVEGVVYDLTEFAPEHPGGAEVLLRCAGRDATASYSEVHAPSLIRRSLPAAKRVGILDARSITPQWARAAAASSRLASAPSDDGKPPLSTLISTHDFEDVAERTLSAKAWAFYSSAATDLHTKRRNALAYSRIGLRPRILRNVQSVSTATTMLGQRMSVPIYASPTALVKLVHPEGEKGIGRACKRLGIPQTVSTQASFPIGEIFDAVRSGPPYGSGDGGVGAAAAADGDGALPIFFQLYVDKQRAKSEKLLAEAERLGVKAIFVTVDAPVPGKREADERVQSDERLTTPMSGVRARNDAKGGALGRIMGSFVDASLAWEDLPWLRRCTTLPIVLKGIQTAMDARLAVAHGIDAIVLSNHGGRSLDTAPASILVLLELQRCCPDIFDALEVYVDGGVARGTDVFKALCLGARAVGIGRGFLYALNYGEEGVEKYIETPLSFLFRPVLKDELEVTMRMCGVTHLSQVHPGLVNSSAVDHLVPASADHPYARWRPKAQI
ncbi:MAG: hypothetical protein M1818_007263 [Claussenomyces sp. TS43310]|nr:MAG: hypothetical protein M1818_007263 [Claussenomyces sp. TS43310]